MQHYLAPQAERRPRLSPPGSPRRAPLITMPFVQFTRTLCARPGGGLGLRSSLSPVKTLNNR